VKLDSMLLWGNDANPGCNRQVPAYLPRVAGHAL